MIRNKGDTKSPNILLITSDQMRRDSIGVYENRNVKTPNIDKIADEAIIFDNHIVQNPVCMPSRWSIFSGKYPRNHGVRDNGVIFKRDEATISRILKENDYRTAAFGKMHLSPQLLYINHEDEEWPDDYFGFDERHLTDDSKKGEYLQYLKEKDLKIYKYALDQGKRKIESDLSSGFEQTFKIAPEIIDNKIPADLHQTSWIADKVINYLSKTDEKPFFIWCSFVDPHPPFDPPEPYASMYDPEKLTLPIKNENELRDKPEHILNMSRGITPWLKKYELFKISEYGWKLIKSKYYGMISLIDYNIGKIVKKLRESEVFDNTIIVITSDHGELLGDHNLLYKGPFHYDGLIRVPLIIKLDNKIYGGLRVNDITKQIDILPTLLDLIGIPVPRNVQGDSLRPLINGRVGVNPEFALIEHDCSDYGFNMKSLRSKQYRFTYYLGEYFGELYDLFKDPNEFYNLWNNDNYKGLKEKLKTKLLDILIETEDRTLERKSKY